MKMGYLLLGITVLLTTGGQLLTKRGSRYLELGGSLRKNFTAMINPYLMLAAMITAVTPIVYIFALKRVELTAAYAFMGLNYILVGLGGRIIFHEPLNGFQYGGMVLIFLGIIVFHL